MSSIKTLEADILAAHARADAYALADLYARAADVKDRIGDRNAAGFLRTHAYVFALESAHPSADALCALLAADGRELSE